MPWSMEPCHPGPGGGRQAQQNFKNNDNQAQQNFKNNDNLLANFKIVMTVLGLDSLDYMVNICRGLRNA